MVKHRGAQRVSISFEEDVVKRPYAYDFFALLRKLECQAWPIDRTRIGMAWRVASELVEINQALLHRPLHLADSRYSLPLAFAPSSVESVRLQPGDGTVAHVATRFFGLLAAGSPLPLSIVSYIHYEILLRNAREGKAEPLAVFLDIFNHRFTSFLYRAWSLSQPVVSADRPDDDMFANYVGALQGLPVRSLRRRDRIPEHRKLWFAGLLGRQAKSASALQSILAHALGVPVRIQEYVGQWLEVPELVTACLNSKSEQRLGVATMLGKRSWCTDTKIRILLGPLTFAQYSRFLPYRKDNRLLELRDWMMNFLGLDLDWDVSLCVRGDEIPTTELKRETGGRLGFTTWLKRPANNESGVPATAAHSYSVWRQPRFGQAAS